jgi:hypothetical protein
LSIFWRVFSQETLCVFVLYLFQSFVATANEQVSAAAGESVVLRPNEQAIGAISVVAREGSGASDL